MQIFSALKSQDRLSEALDKLHHLEIQNKELKKRLTEVKSYEFIEKQARDKLGLAKEGETVVVIPQRKIEEVLGLKKQATDERLPNYLGWWKAFFN